MFNFLKPKTATPASEWVVVSAPPAEDTVTIRFADVDQTPVVLCVVTEQVPDQTGFQSWYYENRTVGVFLDPVAARDCVAAGEKRSMHTREAYRLPDGRYITESSIEAPVLALGLSEVI